METPKKIFTNAGKPIARYTLVCFWKDEHRHISPKTGELCKKWTYRSDDAYEAAKQDGIHYRTELHALKELYTKYKYRCTHMQVWDNSLPQSQALILDAGLDSKGQWQVFSSQKYEQIKNDYHGRAITEQLQQQLNRPPTIQEFLTAMSQKLKEV